MTDAILSVDKRVFPLTSKFQARLDTIMQVIPSFWDQGPHAHFTLHGPSHSERIYRQRLAQLALELPENDRLTADENFIISAAAWLYEIGMQCTTLRPVLDFEWRAGIPLSPTQLLQVREKRHVFAQQMILRSVSRDHNGPTLNLGLTQADDYTQLIAEVCGWCSGEQLEDVPTELPVGGVLVRVRLLVALLRLADQLDIDSSRVNLDLLQAAPLSPKVRARWWAYHYTQTLPIEHGLIKFYYFLPSIHRDLRDHIRGLIEPDFGDTNMTLRYLMRNHRLKLLVDEPGIRYDQSSGFHREMSTDMVIYLREQIRPYPPSGRKEIMNQHQETSVANHCLLVLDFEHFLLQIGQEGHVLSEDEVNRLLVTLLKAAREHYADRIEGLAVGHWCRPDMQEFAESIKELYTLIPVDFQQTSAEVMGQELSERAQHGLLPHQTILVSPQRALMPIIKRLDSQEQSITNWVTNNEDDYRFQALTNHTFLSEKLNLSAGYKIERFEYEQTQTACILSLMSTARIGITFDAVAILLKKVVSTQASATWWRLWLINKNMLTTEKTNQEVLLKLNTQHPTIVTLEQKWQAAIKTLHMLTTDSQGVAQDVLLKELARHAAFKDDSGNILAFFTLLQREEVVSVNVHSSTSGYELPLWQLNTRNKGVLELIVEHYLPFLVMGLDHEMARSGHPVVHEHTMHGRLRNYIEANTLGIVYRLAIEKNWVCSEPDRRNTPSGKQNISVEPMLSQSEVRTTLLQRDILIDILYKAGSKGWQRDALWRELNGIRRFILPRTHVDQWLSIFQLEEIVSIEKDERDSECDHISLCPDTPLVQALIGRMHIYDVILTLRRFLHAVNAETSKPTSLVEERLARHMSRRLSRMVAPWVIEYGKTIHLIGFIAPSGQQAEEQLYLKKHFLVYQLDRRETETCRALTEIVKRLSRLPMNNGWVPQGAVLGEMTKNPLFGYMRNEHEYWINQAVYRAKTLERPERSEYATNVLLRAVNQG
jgi:hypothetical protein